MLPFLPESSIKASLPAEFVDTGILQVSTASLPSSCFRTGKWIKSHGQTYFLPLIPLRQPDPKKEGVEEKISHSTVVKKEEKDLVCTECLP